MSSGFCFVWGWWRWGKGIAASPKFFVCSRFSRSLRIQLLYTDFTVNSRKTRSLSIILLPHSANVVIIDRQWNHRYWNLSLNFYCRYFIYRSSSHCQPEGGGPEMQMFSMWVLNVSQLCWSHGQKSNLNGREISRVSDGNLLSIVEYACFFTCSSGANRILGSIFSIVGTQYPGNDSSRFHLVFFCC